MAHYYNVIIDSSQPSNVPANTFLLRRDTGQIYFAISEEWLPISSGNPVAAVEKNYFNAVTASSSAPALPDVGDIWRNTTNNTLYMYVDSWVILVGA